MIHGLGRVIEREREREKELECRCLYKARKLSGPLFHTSVSQNKQKYDL